MQADVPGITEGSTCSGKVAAVAGGGPLLSPEAWPSGSVALGVPVLTLSESWVCLLEFGAPRQILKSTFLQSPVCSGVHEGPRSQLSPCQPCAWHTLLAHRLSEPLQVRLLSERSGPTSQALLRLSLEHVQFLGGVDVGTGILSLR